MVKRKEVRRKKEEYRTRSHLTGKEKRGGAAAVGEKQLPCLPFEGAWPAGMPGYEGGERGK